VLARAKKGCTGRIEGGGLKELRDEYVEVGRRANRKRAGRKRGKIERYAKKTRGVASGCGGRNGKQRNCVKPGKTTAQVKDYLLEKKRHKAGRRWM